MSKSDEMDNLIVDLINKFDATYQKIMDELPIKLKDPFLNFKSVELTSEPSVHLSFNPCFRTARDRKAESRQWCSYTSELNGNASKISNFYISCKISF